MAGSSTRASAVAEGGGRSTAVAGLEILGEIGRGSNAIVYRARRDDTDYALKMLRTDRSEHDEAATAVRREAGLLACVNHPCVGRVFEVGAVDGSPYLVMELLDGRSLAELLDAGPMPVARAIRLVADLAGALAAAHRVGVVHRDIKPQNIMVVAGGQPKLIDFGLAVHGRQSTDDETAGTFAYSAPEQTGMLARTVDGRADLYSLGVVLFECLTGTLPFDAADVGELIRLHAVAVPPDVSTLRSEVPADVAAVIGRLLAKDPDDRYQDGERLAEELRALSGALYGLPYDSAAMAPSARRPLVGRRSELARLEARCEQAWQGNGGAVRLTGPSGSGKTRLADELADRVADAGHPVLALSCVAGAAPLAPVRTALEHHVRDLERLTGAEREQAIGRLRSAAGAAASVLQLLSPALANVLQAPTLTDEDRQEQLGTAVTAFLGSLARVEGGLLLHVDNAQWVDSGTARVLGELERTLGDCPLLVLTTEPAGANTDEGSAQPPGGAPDSHVPLRPLAEAQVAELASTQLGGAAVDGRLAAQLTARSGGNPFAVLEYLRAMLDACVIRPYWGSWLLDERALDRLSLPADVLDLVVARIEAVPRSSRRLLVTAAVMGASFRSELLAEVCGISRAEAVTAVEQALSCGILEPDGGSYAFLHARVREALLADQGEATIRTLHQRIAEALDRVEPELPGQWYVIASHYAAGNRDERPDRMYRACFAAALTVLAEQAPARALDYLALAGDAARRGALDPDHAYYRALGVAQSRVGQLGAARASLEAACAREPEPIRRAELLGLVAETQQHAFASNESVTTIRRALAEAGHPLPANPLLLVISTVWLFAASLVGGRSARRSGFATGVDRDRFRTQAALLETGAMGAGVGMHKLLFICLHLRSAYAVSRLGPGPEYVRLHTGYGMFLSYAKARRLARRCFDRAAAVARATGDPRLIAHVPWTEAMTVDGTDGIGRTSGNALRAVLQEHGRWLDLGQYQFAVAALGSILTFRGYAAEASSWYDRARARMDAAVAMPRNPVVTLGVYVAACAGDRRLTDERLAELRDSASAERDDPVQKVNAVLGVVYAAVLYGDDVQRVAAEVRRLRLTPRRVWITQRHLWLDLARGHLASLRAATPEQRPDRLVAARRALRTLRWTAGGPALRAYYHAMYAEYLRQTGAERAALRRLARADLLGQSLDLPLLGCEVATIRARTLDSLGHRAEAGRQAEHAVRLAALLGLEQQGRNLRAELRVSATASSSPVNRTPRVGRSGNAVAGPAGRRLTALQQISVAAATVLDLDQLVRVALDETIGIFAAERAIIFLPDSATGRLAPHVGRSALRADLDELTGYGSTFVDQVAESGEALVVTSGEHGVALGSQSVVVHGLRSVMVAPLQWHGELLGAVYLDSRVAKGVFTEDDVDTLTTIASQVAASMVTAQAAQLAATVRAAERRSELADTMRTSMAEVSETLDPDAVTARLLATLVRAIGADLGVVLLRDGTFLSTDVVDAAGRPGPAGVLEPALAALFDAIDSPCLGVVDGPDAPVVALLPAARAWLAIPLASRERRVGLLVLASAGDGYDDGQLRVAAVLAEQGMVAYDNAVLHHQVQQLASTDPLTGLYNRRTFFALCAERLQAAGRRSEPIAAVMLDIDHFKRVNDTHGHAAGDDVIREVAGRLQRVLRHDDLLGRYGGEEFALFLPGNSVADTAQLAERLRQVVAATPIPTRDGPLGVTISVGTTLLRADDHTVEDALARADEALYRAKQDGRNRVAAG